MTDFSYLYDNAMITGLLSSLNAVIRVPSTLLGIAGYILTALALSSIAQRRGLNKPWLAWIPVANLWLIGSLSDQYQYVVNGANKSKRKALLWLTVSNLVLTVMIVVLAIIMAVQAIMGVSDSVSEEALLSMILGPALGVLGLCLPILGISIAFAIIRYMALYDIYKSLDPSNCVLFLVLSILFSVTEPFFLFFNREKDLGMPPRRQEPAYTIPQAEPQYESWENKDYL